MSWWDALREYLDERERERARTDDETPDPWADVELGKTALTDEQVAFLAFDQPSVPRLGGLTPRDHGAPDRQSGNDTTDETTGNSPGDA